MADQDNSSQPTCVHAHWDCSNGVSGYSMLAACLDATEKEEAYGQLAVLEELILKGIPKDVCVKKFSLQMRREATAMRVLVVRKRSLEECRSDNATVKVEQMPQINGSQVKAMLEKADASKIPAWVREKSLEVLDEMGKAAAAICHTDSLDPVYIDYGLEMIIEVVGTLLSLNGLRVRTVSCSPLPLGAGTTSGAATQPAPLTLKLLIGMPTYPGPSGLTGEVVTATGAALLRVLTNTSRSQKNNNNQTVILRAVGFGSSEMQHVVRLSVGDVQVSGGAEKFGNPFTKNQELNVQSSLWDLNTLTHMEANLDDITAEHLSFAVDQLLENGAIDAWVVPIIMKKGRAAHTLHCLCRSDKGNEEKLKKLLEVIFKHTTTLGIRIHHDVSRVALRRSFVTIQTPYQSAEASGSVDVKVGYMGNKPISVKAEFDHCKKISIATGVPLKKVAETAEHEAYVQLEREAVVKAEQM